MLKFHSRFSPLVIASILACGINMAWLIVCGIAFAMSESLLPDLLPHAFAGRAAFTVLLPSPLFLGWEELFMRPMQNIHNGNGNATDYLGALVYDRTAIVSTMTFVGVLSILLAVWCFNRNRRYSNRPAIAWAIFVLITGVPGFIGYLLHCRWPVLVRCTHCGQKTPRDRDACLKCNTAFPPPALKGIEVIA